MDRRPGRTVRVAVTTHTADGESRSDDRVVAEEPLEIRIAAAGLPAVRAWVTMRTPGHDFELAAGCAVCEGLTTPSAIRTVAYCTDVDLSPEEELNVVTLHLDSQAAAAPARHRAQSAGSSACGVCGKDSVREALAVRTASPWSGPRASADVVRRLPEALRSQQKVFDQTGGVHAAALATHDGRILVAREDVGRHNAVDKVVGARVLRGEPPAEACLVVSGRAGFELVQKAAAVGIGAMVAVGAPTSLSVQLAEQAGMDLWGFTSPARVVRFC